MDMACVGVFINVLQVGYVATRSGVDGVVAAIMLIPLAVSIVGITLVVKGRERAGATWVMVGTLPFLPLGLIGFFGALKFRRSLGKRSAAGRRQSR